jgi:hypothetical protein
MLEFEKSIRHLPPPNGLSLNLHIEAYQEIVNRELYTRRYIGPLSLNEVEQLIGYFQSSLLSLVPKPGKINKF